jgi:hypothetical protein
VLVPSGGAEVAREVLGTPRRGPRAPRPLWVRTLAAVLAVLVLALVATAVVAAIVG